MKSLTLKLIILGALIFTNLSFAQVAVTFQPDSNSCQNAVVWDLYPNTPRPNDILFQGSAWTSFGIPEIYRSLVQFDLSIIPVNAIIDSAFLSLYGYVDAWNGHSTLSGSNESVLKRITSAWNENTVTWNTQPPTTSIDQVNLPVSNFAGEDYLHHDIKNIVQFWVSNPSGNYGLFYQLQIEQHYRRMSFSSPASADSTKRPLLNIFYSVPNGINYFSEDKSEVFPNPFSNKLNASVRNMQSEIILYDIAARKLMQQIFTNSVSLNTEQLARGIYIYEVRDKNGLCKKGKVVKD